jgi:hypothetical protein
MISCKRPVLGQSAVAEVLPQQPTQGMGSQPDLVFPVESPVVVVNSVSGQLEGFMQGFYQGSDTVGDYRRDVSHGFII